MEMDAGRLSVVRMVALVVVGAWASTGCNDGVETQVDAIVGSRAALTTDDSAAFGRADAPARTPTGGICAPNGWCWENPLPQRPQFHGVWGAGPSDVWATSEAGALLHYDGRAWRFVGAHTDARLYGIWGAGRQDIWAVGQGGAIVHYDGTRWSSVASPTSVDLGAVSGSGRNDVWAVGAPGGESIALHFDGTVWKTIDLGAPGVVPSGVWTVRRNEVWIVGNDSLGQGAILHGNGRSFTLASPGSLPLLAVWGSGAADIYAAGGSRRQGVLLHFDGAVWTEIPTSGPGIASVWGSGPRDVWVAGALGRINHFDGLAWTAVPSPTTDLLDAVWGSGATDVWALGIGTSDDGRPWLHWDGVAWTSVVTGVTFEDLAAIAAVAANDVYFTGGRRAGLVHFDGHGLSSLTLPVLFEPHDAFAAALGDVFIVGSRGLVFHGSSANGWVEVATGTTSPLRGVHGTGSQDVWAVGDQGTALHWDGQAFTPFATGTTLIVQDVWAAGPADVWFVVEDGTILHWDGATITSVPNGSTFPDGALSVVAGSGPNNVWAAGRDILHFDGQAWRSTRQGLPSDPNGEVGILVGTVLPLGVNDVWMFGTPGAHVTPQATYAYHFDGTTWSPSPIGSPSASLVARVGGELWAVGKAGTILHRSSRR